MKKKAFLVIIIIVICFLSFTKRVNAYGYCKDYFMNTDKTCYYNDEFIIINASWNLQYDMGEISFVQIQIYNETNALVWSSAQFHEKGNQSKLFCVDIDELDISIQKCINHYSIIFFYHWHDLSSSWNFNLTKINIETIKRNTSCELVDFPEAIFFGDFLTFKANFYDTSENQSFLISQNIDLKIQSNSFVTYQKNFLTNTLGSFQVNISSNENLTIGINFLIFELKDDLFYNDIFYENKILVRIEEINERKSENDELKNDNPIQFNIISFLSVFIISFCIFTLIYHNNVKKTKHQKLIDNTFRY